MTDIYNMEMYSAVFLQLKINVIFKYFHFKKKDRSEHAKDALLMVPFIGLVCTTAFQKNKFWMIKQLRARELAEPRSGVVSNGQMSLK